VDVRDFGGADAAASADAAATTASATASTGKSKRLVFTAETPPEESDTYRLYGRPRDGAALTPVAWSNELLFRRIGR
jgi:hypothetical protein